MAPITQMTSTPLLEVEPRFEHKYLIDVKKYLDLRQAFSPWTKPDSFCEKMASGRYFIRSLYFDTPRNYFYHQKVDGENDRLKLRFRTYSASPDADSPVYVELKVRDKGSILKFKTKVSLAECHVFFAEKRWKNYEDPILIEVERIVRKYQLIPKILVDYQREALVSYRSDDARITFDHDLQYSFAETLTPSRSIVRTANPSIVLEIKIKNHLSGWLKRIVRDYDLQVTANSKFVNAMNQVSYFI